MFKRLYRPFEINRALEVYFKVKSLRKTESIVKISNLQFIDGFIGLVIKVSKNVHYQEKEKG